jgi:predicted O-methyltransferase YrrM
MLTLREINDYVTSLVPLRPEECARMEEVARQERFPIIGPACGNLCYLMARMMGARRIFELGSGFGYSTCWFARAVRDNGGGVVHHTVWDEGLSARAREHLAKLELAQFVSFHVGEAVEALSHVEGQFDLMFCDIDKHAYPEALVEMDRRLRPGGVVIFDNMLLHGSVLPSRRDNPPPPPPGKGLDPAAMTKRHEDNLRGVLDTTQMLFDGVSWIASLIPLRDGLAMAMKVGDE